jgi:hypothetical protein
LSWIRIWYRQGSSRIGGSGIDDYPAHGTGIETDRIDDFPPKQERIEIDGLTGLDLGSIPCVNPGPSGPCATPTAGDILYLNFCLIDRLPKVDIKDFKSIPAVDGALPAADFGAGTYDAKDDDTCSLTRAARLKWTAHMRVCEIWALFLRYSRSTCTLISETEDFDFEECDDSD